MKHTFRAAAAALIAVMAFNSTPAQAATPGLFGSADPTYDGVFRQSLAILALKAAGASVPESAKSWLLAQQCNDGAFQAFRDSSNCWEYSNDTYTGKDTNSTAIAVLALDAIGARTPAKRGLAWLRSAQNSDGGMPFSKAGTSDSMSTGLAIAAARALGVEPNDVGQPKSLISYLRTTMLGCSASVNRGGLAYMAMKPLAADNMSSAQVLAGLSAMPQTNGSLLPATLIACPASVPSNQTGLRNALAGYLAAQLRANSYLLPSAYGGTDYSSTAWTVIGLVGANRGSQVVTLTTDALAVHVKELVTDSNGVAQPGKLALATMVAIAAGRDPRSFGRRNLLVELKRTLQ